ncbi:MAG: hypothetical protein KDC85_09410, partial [Saprospiraceae bacterium]|nr:hypothetical protein [Saprospiraceae bacterium]
KLTSCLSELDLDEDTYSQCDALAEQLEAVYMSAPNGFDLVNYEYQIKERYLDPELPTYWKGGEYLAKYAILEFENETAFTAKWHTEFNDLEDNGIVFDIGFYELAYDPLDVLSLIPGIGEVADGAILLVGLSELIWGEDTERALTAISTSGVGLFLIGENYVEVPLKQGKKLFIGPSIGFVTKQTIAEGADPVRVKKLFGLAESSYGSTAQKLVTTTVEDGRKLHRVILENDKLFDHIRVMPKPERQAFLAEMADNPKVLKQIFDDASVTMKPVALWRKVNALGAPAREAIQALDETGKIAFYTHLEQYGDEFYALMAKHSESIDAVGCWKEIRNEIEALGINETGMFKAKTLLADLEEKVWLLNYFKDRPTFVKAWDVLYGQGDDALVAMRTNTSNLDIVDEYLYEYPESITDTQIDYILATNKQEYVDDLLGPGQPGDYIKHRVRGLYDEISVEDDLGGKLSDVVIGNGILTYVAPDIGIKPGIFERSYDASQNLFTFKVGFIRDAPPWLDNGQVPLVEGKGIPTQMFASLRQMKMMGIPDGSLTNSKMSMIQNARTMLEVTKRMNESNLADLTQFGAEILEVSSVDYAVSTLKQAGYRISEAGIGTNLNVKLITPEQALINYQITEMTQELLDEYGFDWSDQIYVNFDILFTLEPF